MQDSFDYKKYLQSNILLKENEDKTGEIVDQLKDEMDSILKGMDQELSKEEQAQLEEGLLTIASIAIALPAIIGLIARLGKAGGALVNKMLGKKPETESEYQAWMDKLSKVAEDLHHLYLGPIESIVGKFVKDHDKAKKIANTIFHVIVATFLFASGATALKAFKAQHLSLATLEGALAAIKGGEVTTFIKSAFN